MDQLATRPYDFDDDLMNETRGDGQAHVRVYPWESVAVVIGRGGKQELELDTKAIVADEIPLFKRPGGGCAVVLDPGNVIVSVTLPLPGLAGIKTAFAGISTWLADNLTTLQITGVQQVGVSDLAIGSRKIGGSCVYRTRDLLYYSTTLLVDPDLELVERYLLHPPREPEYRQGRSHREFMGRLSVFPSAAQANDLALNLDRLLKTSLTSLSDALTEA